MRSYNYSDNKTISGYVGATNAQLKIMSVPTNRILQFPAFLTDFSQTFDATWNTEDVFGRMDPIATYQGTKRTMSLGFDLPAGSLEEAKHNLAGCSELVKMVYPVYNKGILSKPPLVRIQFANLIKGSIGIDADSAVENVSNTVNSAVAAGISNALQTATATSAVQSASKPQQFFGLLGWISGLSWKPTLDMGMFTGGEELYPKIIGISFSFNILHEQTLSQPDIGSFPFGEIK